MGTRAVITFVDEDNTFHVYQHWDGNPETVLANIEAAKLFAWGLPRFEADEFAAAYVRNCKSGEGNIRLTKSYDDHCDLAYRYVVRPLGGGLDVRVFTPVFDANDDVSGWVKYVPEDEAAA